MRNRKRNRWLDIPWGWVLVSAYCTALVCVGVSQATGVEAALGILKDYQTLIAGLATIAALLIAVQQLKRQNRRDAIDAVRHYEPEIDAMSELETELVKVHSAATGLASSFAMTGAPIPFDRKRWLRLQHQANTSLAPAISGLMEAVEEHNRWSAQVFATPFGRVDHVQQKELQAAIGLACHSLRAAIRERRRQVQELIEAMS